MWLSKLLTGKDFSIQRANVLKAFNEVERQEILDTLIPSTIDQAKHNLRKTQKDCKEVIKQAQQWREKELEKKARALAMEQKSDEASILRRILLSEQERKEFNHMRQVLVKGAHGGLNRLLAPSEDPTICVETLKQQHIDPSDWIPILESDKIEELLMTRNQHHFSQAKGTPFMMPPLSEVLGWHGMNEASDRVLNGDLKFELALGEATTKIIDEIGRK